MYRGRPPKRSSDEVMYAIRRLMNKKGIPPTLEELKVELDVKSVRTVMRYLSLLEEQGRIVRWRGGRGIKILDEKVSE